MAATSIQNPAAVVESKSAKKKKGKTGRTESPAPVASSEKAMSVAANEGNGDDASEPAYLRELSKNIRNLNKKLTNASKTDSVIAENKDKSLDELVSLKIINADQKAQHLKKPALQAQLSQLEEQYNQFKKLDSDYRLRLVTDKEEVTKSLTAKFEKEKADAIREAANVSAAAAKKSLHDGLLILSQFLRLAAARRADDQNAQLDENLALEGVLLQVYSGDENGVSTMQKLVDGADEATKGVSGETLQTTFAQVKAAAAANSTPALQFEESATDSTQETAAKSPVNAESDPTVVHASLTEIEAGDDATLMETAVLTNGHAMGDEHISAIANADVADDAANAAGESQWDTPNGTKDMSSSQEWVEVPHDPTETGTTVAPTTNAAENVQSWADEQPDHSPPAVGATPTAESNDGFHQVQRHNRGRSERDGWRGRGGGYRGRGRGADGRGRGRGRGGNGGGNGGYFRAPRRNEEA